MSTNITAAILYNIDKLTYDQLRDHVSRFKEEYPISGDIKGFELAMEADQPTLKIAGIAHVAGSDNSEHRKIALSLFVSFRNLLAANGYPYKDWHSRVLAVVLRGQYSDYTGELDPDHLN